MRSSKFQGASFSDGTESKSNRRNAAKPALQRTATLSTLATEIVRISYGKYTCVDLKDHKYVIYLVLIYKLQENYKNREHKPSPDQAHLRVSHIKL
ncbi:unnamed protein product [Brassica oleracea var. botrytis]